MNKTISVMQNIADICSELRVRYYGNDFTAKDYRDSYIINQAIDEFAAEAELLMEEAITKEEQIPKFTKSINFRASSWEKLNTLSKILNITPMEVCRRILHYTIMNDSTVESSSVNHIRLASLKSKLSLLEAQIESCKQIIAEISEEISKIEAV